MAPQTATAEVRPRPARRVRRFARRPERAWAILILALLASGLLWRVVRYGLGFPIWGDEAFVAVDFIQRSYADMLQPTTYGQIVPLTFMWAELAISHALGLSEWALRLLPFLAGLASLLLFWRFAVGVLPRWSALLAIGFFAASIYLVRHAAEVKPYATDLLVSLALLTLAWRVHIRPRRAGAWLAVILLGAAAPWCSYPAIFVAATAGVLLVWQSFRALRAPSRPQLHTTRSPADRKTAPALAAGTLAFGIFAGGSFLLMYLVYGRPHAQHAAHLTEIAMWSATFPPLLQFWKLPLWFVAIHTGNMLAYPLGSKAPGSLITFILVVIGSYRLWKTRRDLLWLLLGPLIFTFFAAAMKAYPYGGSARTSLYMAPAFCLLGGLGLFATLRYFVRLGLLDTGRRLRISVHVAAIVLICIAVGGAVADVVKPYKSDPVQRSWEAVQDVLHQTRPGDRWVVFNATEKVDYAPWLGDWRGTGGQFVFDVLRFHPVPLAWAPRPETVAPDPGGRVWLFSYRGWKIPFPEEQLASYLKTIEQRLGPAEHKQYFLKEKKGQLEAIDLYVFGPPE
jgi:hypothetical protein